MRLFIDSSALAKRYIRECGSDQVLAHCAEADEIILSVLAVPEVMSGLNRLRREHSLSEDMYLQAKGSLAADVAGATVVGLTPAIVGKAVSCLESATLRAPDAIHVASALECQADLFLSADLRQCKAARAMGLKVEQVPV